MKIPLGIRFGRILLALVCRPIASILFPYTFINRKNIPEHHDALIVCCNHISMVDPVFLLLAFRRPIYFLAKDSLFRNPLIGWFWKTVFGLIPVSRGKGDTGAITKSLSILEEGSVLGIFPEGTRSKDGKLGPAKSGAAMIAAKSKASVLPCAIITNSGKLTPFKRTTIVFGEMLTPEDLHLEGDKPDIRFASRRLMAVIAELIEENRS